MRKSKRARRREGSRLSKLIPSSLFWRGRRRRLPVGALIRIAGLSDSFLSLVIKVPSDPEREEENRDTKKTKGSLGERDG